MTTKTENHIDRIREARRLQDWALAHCDYVENGHPWKYEHASDTFACLLCEIVTFDPVAQTDCEGTL